MKNDYRDVKSIVDELRKQGYTEEQIDDYLNYLEEDPSEFRSKEKESSFTGNPEYSFEELKRFTSDLAKMGYSENQIEKYLENIGVDTKKFKKNLERSSGFSGAVGLTKPREDIPEYSSGGYGFLTSDPDKILRMMKKDMPDGKVEYDEFGNRVFVTPDGQRLYPNSPGLSPADLKRAATDLGVTTAATLATAPLGFAGRAAGSAALEGGAEALIQALRGSQEGIGAEQGIREGVPDILGTMAGSVLGESAAALLGPRPLTKTVADELYPLTKGQRSIDPVTGVGDISQLAKEQLARQNVLSPGGQMMESFRSYQDALRQELYADEFADEIAAGRLEKLPEEIRKVMEQDEETYKKLFQRAVEKAGRGVEGREYTMSVDPDNFVVGIQKYGKPFDETLHPKSQAAIEYVGKKLSETGGTLKIEDYELIRTALREMSRDARGDDRRVLAGIIKGYDEEIKRNAKTTIEKEAFKAFRMARKKYQWFKEIYDDQDSASQIIQRLVDPRNPISGREAAGLLIGESAIKETGARRQAIARLKSRLSPESFDIIKKGFLSQIFFDKGNRLHDPIRIVNHIDAFLNSSPELAKLLFSPEEIEKLRRIRNIEFKLHKGRHPKLSTVDYGISSRGDRITGSIIGQAFGRIGAILGAAAPGILRSRRDYKVAREAIKQEIIRIPPSLKSRVASRTFFDTVADEAMAEALDKYGL